MPPPQPAFSEALIKRTTQFADMVLAGCGQSLSLLTDAFDQSTAPPPVSIGRLESSAHSDIEASYSRTRS